MVAHPSGRDAKHGGAALMVKGSALLGPLGVVMMTF